MIGLNPGWRWRLGQVALALVLVMGPALPAHAGDGDGDNIDDAFDNCPYVPNAAQQDWNDNGIGDACDMPPGDLNGDGHISVADALCGVLTVLSPTPAPSCLSPADILTADMDCDGSVDVSDVTWIIRLALTLHCDPVTGACPAVLTAQVDADGDNVSDVCEELASIGCAAHLSPAFPRLSRWLASVSDGAEWAQLSGYFAFAGPAAGGSTHTLTLPHTLDFSAMGAPFVSFEQRATAGTRRVEVSVDGSSWVTAYSATASVATWDYAVVDLGAYAGAPVLHLRLTFIATASDQSWDVRALNLLDASGPMPTWPYGTSIDVDSPEVWRMDGEQALDEETCAWSTTSGWVPVAAPPLYETVDYTGARTMRMSQPLSLTGSSYPTLYLDEHYGGLTRQVQVSFDGGLTFTSVGGGMGSTPAAVYRVAAIPLYGAGGTPLGDHVMVRLYANTGTPGHFWRLRSIAIRDRDAAPPLVSLPHTLAIDASAWSLEATQDWTEVDGWHAATDSGWQLPGNETVHCHGWAGSEIYATYERRMDLSGSSAPTLYLDHLYGGPNRKVLYSLDEGASWVTALSGASSAPVWRQVEVPLYDGGGPLADTVMVRVSVSTGTASHTSSYRYLSVRERDPDPTVVAAPHVFTYGVDDWESEALETYAEPDGWQGTSSGWRPLHDAYLDFGNWAGGPVYSTYQLAIDVSALTSPTLTFENFYSGPTRTISVSVDGGDTWTQVGGGTGSVPVWRRRSIPLYDGGGKFGDLVMVRFGASTGSATHYSGYRNVRIAEFAPPPTATLPATVDVADAHMERPESYDPVGGTWVSTPGWQSNVSPDYFEFSGFGGGTIYLTIQAQFDLQGVTEPTLYFYERFLYPHRYVEYSADFGATWVELEHGAYAEGYAGWRSRAIPLYDGGGNLAPSLMLRVGATTGYTSHWWELRDIELRARDPLPAQLTAGVDPIPLTGDAWEVHGDPVWDEVNEVWTTDTTGGWHEYSDRGSIEYYGGTDEMFAILQRRIDISALSEPTLYLYNDSVSPARKVYLSTDYGATWTEIYAEAYATGSMTWVTTEVPLYDGGGPFGSDIMLRFSGETGYNSHYWKLRGIDVRERDGWPADVLDASLGYVLDAADFYLEQKASWSAGAGEWVPDGAWLAQLDGTLTYSNGGTSDWRSARLDRTVDVTGMNEPHVTIEVTSAGPGFRVEASRDAGDSWHVLHEQPSTWSSGGPVTLDVDLSTVDGQTPTQLLLRLRAYSINNSYTQSVTAMDFYDASPISTYVDPFSGTALAAHWTQTVGSHTYSVSGGQLTITDTSYPPETQGWIYDIDCSYGNQIRWDHAIGTGDFDLDLSMSYTGEAAYDVFGGGVGLVDASNNLVAVAGWRDGSSAWAGGLYGEIATGVCGDGVTTSQRYVSWDWNGSAAFSISRTSGAITIELPSGAPLVYANTDSIAGVVLWTLKHHTTAYYSFGTIRFDNLSISY